MKPGLTRAGVLGGGGSLGAFLAAVIYQLLANGTLALKDYFTFLIGTSTGGLGSVMLAYNGVGAYLALWATLVTKNVYQPKDTSGLPFNEVCDMLLASWKGELNDAPLRDLIHARIVAGSRPTIPCGVKFVDMESGHAFVAWAYPDGTFQLKDNFGLAYDYPESWFPQFLNCVLATASTEGGVDAVAISLSGGTDVTTGSPTPSTTLQGMDGGPARLVPLDDALALSPQETVVISLSDRITAYSGTRSLEGTIERSVAILLDNQFELTQKYAKLAQGVLSNIVWYAKPATPTLSAEVFDPKASAALEADGAVAQPLFGVFLT